MDPKALAAAREALAKGTATDEQKVLVEKADAEALLKAAQDADAKGTATDEQKALLAKVAADAEAAKVALVKDGKAIKPKSAPVQKWLANDGTPFDSKREAEVHNLHLEKQAELAPGVARMDALLKAAKKPADEDEDEEGDDEETKKAKKARRDEKAAKAKEKEEADKAAAAIELAKQEKEAAELAAAELAKTAPAKVEVPAKAAPVAKAATTSLKKGLHQIGWMANLLSDLQCLQGSVEFEQMWEQDTDSELPGKFKALVSQMCEVLVALVDEETEELIEDGIDEDVEILEMAAGLRAGHPEAIAKSMRAKAEPLVKSDSKKESEAGAALVKFAETLEKAGARHSKADAERVQALHDHAEDVHKCMGEMAEKCADMHKAAAEAKNTAIDLGAKGERADDEDDADGVGKSAVKMSKLYEQLNAKADEVLAITKVAAASNETLLKAIPLIEGLQTKVGALEQEKSELVKRMEHLEKQPAAPKGHVRAFSKTQDGGSGDANAKAEFEAKLAKMSPSERHREEMKKAMSNPMELPAL
jgi:hypothetical protein